MNESGTTLKEHDVTDLIGLRVVVLNTAREIDDDGGVEIPEIETLAAAAAVARCLMPLRLRGNELKAIRRIAGWTAADLAAEMRENTSVETISRWENEKQPMGGYAEKVFRLVVCEALAKSAPGVGYQAGAIAKLTVLDPWRADAGFVVPHLMFERVKVMDETRKIITAWEYDKPDLIAA